MKKTMICPKCGNEMEIGEIGVDAFSRGMPILFWAPKEVFNKFIPGFITTKKAVAEGGMAMKIDSGMVHDRTIGYACKACNCVLLNFE